VSVPKLQVLMAAVGALKSLVWISLYVTMGIVVPSFLTRAWNHQHGREAPSQPKQLFRNGELGLASLWLAISVIWNLQTSLFFPHIIALGSLLLVSGGIMASTVWIETYCRVSTGVPHNPDRSWRDSRNMTFLVLSIAAVTQILLDRYAKVAMQ
jgi:hypothetical protein